MRAAVALAAIALAACAGDPVRPPEDRTRVVEVPVPIAVPCFDEKDRPQIPEPTPIDLDNATTDQLAAALARDEELGRQYMREVEALFIQCMAKAGKPVSELQPPKGGPAK